MRNKICFMGTPEYARTVLQALIDAGHEVVLCCCQPDKPVGRKKVITPPPTKVLALEHGIEVFQPDSMKTDESYEKIRSVDPDIIVTAAYGKILPQRVLDIPSKGSLNVHGSLLPHLRGAAPVQYAIMEGLSNTGVTIMLMDAGIDTGDILAKEEVAIDIDDDTEVLMDKLARSGAELLIDLLPKYLNGEIKAVKQDESGATYCAQLKPDAGIIDWNMTSRNVHDLVRALTSWPGASTLLNGEKLKIYRTRLVDFESDAKPGEIVKAHKGDLYIRCGEGHIAIDELQQAGGKRLKAIDCAHNFKTGTILGA